MLTPFFMMQMCRMFHMQQLSKRKFVWANGDFEYVM